MNRTTARNRSRLPRTAPALRVLEPLLTGGKQVHWYLPVATRLGTGGALLLPATEELLRAPEPWPRMAAAEAHWRITGNPAQTAPILADLTGASRLACRHWKY